MDCTSRLSCDAEQSMLKGEDAEPTKGSSLKEVDATLDLLIIIVSGMGVDHQQRSAEEHALKMQEVCTVAASQTNGIQLPLRHFKCT